MGTNYNLKYSHYTLSLVMQFLFVCIGNSCRSQLAEAVARELGHQAQSAGTEPAAEVHPFALKVLELNKVSNIGLRPKMLDSIEIGENTIVCTMGCGVACPKIRIDYDFKIPDPKDAGMESFQQVFEVIQRKIRAISLVESMRCM